MSKFSSIEGLCKQFIDSLIGGTKYHTLCLNLAEPEFDALNFVQDELKAREQVNISGLDEPTPTEFRTALAGISGNFLVAHFQDLDKKPECMDLLAEHVKKDHPGGQLIVVSRHWNSDNTEKERELRKYCLFYQQNLAKKPK